MRDAWWAGMAEDRAQLLPRLRGLLAEHTGLIFPPERWHSIERAVETVGKEQGFSDARSWLQWFTTAAPTLEHMELLVSHLTIGETYFFRDRALFAALREMIFPALIDSRRYAGRYLRLWSAGCSTGEEPYSIAITLQQLLPDWRQWQIALLATDINPNSVAKAQAGIYDSWSFRSGVPRHDDNFTATATGSFEVADSVKAIVRFAQLNLATATYPTPTTDFHSMDIIFCRNVLMYLEPTCARAIIDRFSRTLVEGGWLILSAVEASLVELPQFTSVRLQDLILFKKDSQAANGKDSQAAARNSAAAAREQNARHSAQASAAIPTRTSSRISESPRVAPQVRTASQIAAAAQKNTQKKVVANKTEAPPQSQPSAVQTALNAGAKATVAALIEQARAHADSGQLAAALQFCEQAIAIDKLNPAWTDLLAFILLEQGANAAAETALKRTLYLDRDRVLTHVNLGNLLMQQLARRGEAQRHFRTALEILQGASEQQVLPDTDGITAGQLRQIIETTLAIEMSA